MNAQTKRFLELYDWLKYQKKFIGDADFCKMIKAGSPTAITFIKTRKRNVSSKVIIAFCIKFNVNLKYIIKGELPKFVK